MSFLWGQVQYPCVVLHSSKEPENRNPGIIFPSFGEVLVEKP